MRILEWTVSEESAGKKVKSFVRSDMGVSYHQYAVMKREESLTRNGNPVRANDIVQAGDILRVELPEEDAHEFIMPEDLPVDVVYEDNDILILDKPAPLPCQCSPKQGSGTLENRLAARYGKNFVFRPVNRLDKGTSGLMCVAKHAHAYQALQRLLHTDAYQREYLAVAEGEFSGRGTIDLPISKENDATVKRVIDAEHGRKAVTHYDTICAANGYTLVHIALETGRTHQIRVHLSAIGHPVAGDFLYGHESEALAGRFALHSAYIRLPQPVTKEIITLESPMPSELTALLGDGI